MNSPADFTGLQSVARLTALQKSGLLDSPPEPAFDRLTVLATKALRIPVALVSLVDRNRQFFKSQCGLTAAMARHRQTPLSHSFCQHVVLSQEPLVIDDARVHPLVMDNLAIRDLGVIAYAGVPLVDAEGFALGALCAIDTQPRVWTKNEVEILRALAAQASAEIALRNRVDQLGDDLGSVRRLARFTLHDLRTPLNSLRLNLEALGLMGELNDEQWECLVTAQRSTTVLTQLTENLLEIDALSQHGSSALHISECVPADLIRTAIEQTKSLAVEKRISLESSATPSAPPLCADEGKLVRVLVNLIANAVKFTPKDGSVSVAAAPTAGGAWNFSVRDTGSGIPSAAAQTIFDEGYSSEKSGSTGLGLAFCRHVIEAHSGRIWLETASSPGSEFCFTIPRRAPEPSPPSAGQ